MADPAYVTELERNYPRIAEKLTLMWGRPDLSAYLSHLLIDERGDRHGFSQDIMSEIMFITNLHEDITASMTPASDAKLWDNPLMKNLKA